MLISVRRLDLHIYACECVEETLEHALSICLLRSYVKNVEIVGDYTKDKAGKLEAQKAELVSQMTSFLRVHYTFTQTSGSSLSSTHMCIHANTLCTHFHRYTHMPVHPRTNIHTNALIHMQIGEHMQPHTCTRMHTFNGTVHARKASKRRVVIHLQMDATCTPAGHCRTCKPFGRLKLAFKMFVTYGKGNSLMHTGGCNCCSRAGNKKQGDQEGGCD